MRSRQGARLGREMTRLDPYVEESHIGVDLSNTPTMISLAVSVLALLVGLIGSKRQREIAEKCRIEPRR